MKLRNKVLIVVSVVWAFFLVSAYIGSQHILMRSFLQLEQARAERDALRVDGALQRVIYSLHTFTTDWAHWNDAYSFMQGKNPAFIQNNFTVPAFVNSTINFIGYWNIKNQLVAGMSIDTEAGKKIAYPNGLQEYLTPQGVLLNAHDINKDVRGMLLLPSGIMMVAASSITNGEKSAPSLGTVIAGRYLSPTILKTLQDTTQLKIDLLTLNQVKQNPFLNRQLKRAINNSSGHVNQAKDENTLLTYSVIRDISGNAIALLQIATPRIVYLSGTHAIDYFFISYAILAIIFSALIILLIHLLIVKRLEQLNYDVAEISERKLLSSRVDASGNDEISSVSKQINNMLEIIEESHEQLEQRVEERSHELKKSTLQLAQEIDERKNIEEELVIHKEHLMRLAHYDSLTSLPNRLFFNEILNKAISHANRHKKQLAILFIDLDRFKKINDALGHPTGDLVLNEISKRFSKTLRAGDILARLGGDEFIILLNDIDHPKFASPVAEKLLQVTAEPILISHHKFFITASIGICIYPDDGATLEDLQKNADLAMYKAKHSGGGIFHYFTPEMNSQAHEHIQLETALRKAINNNEFVLHFQPKLNLSDGTLNSVEALVRWENPDIGLISPNEFIPLAEETGLIMQIGEWALREACKINKSWQEQGYQPICVAVNLSPKQFRTQDISQLVAGILAETGLEAKYLELEITETAVMENVEDAVTKLNEIRDMGVNISLDDFGTGYTSINYLKQFPINLLKIDQNFIKGIPQNQNDLAITSAIIALAHSLGIKVVAEGVETAEQLQFLADHNCDIVQGYFLSRPLPEQKIVLQFTRL